MKQRSLRFRMLLPVIAMILCTVALMTALFSRSYISMMLKRENDTNTVGFETISGTVTPLIRNSVSETRSIMADDRVASYARLHYGSTTELVHARINCGTYLSAEIERHDGIYGLLFMRQDGSLFGTLPEATFFLDKPEENQLPETVKKQILDVPLGRTVWIGPLTGAEICGFDNGKLPQSVMIAASKSVDVRYGECYALMLMDESILAGLFAPLQDGESIWRLFTEDRHEFFHTGEETCRDPERLISESNSGKIFRIEEDRPICAFSMTLESPGWTMTREVSMDEYERVVSGVRRSVAVAAGIIFLVALVVYELWLRKFLRQFNSLQDGIIRIGQGDLDPIRFEPFTIREFDRMQLEINNTSHALNRQMETIRRMEREQVEQENRKKEQERIDQELRMAREIQLGVLPAGYPAFPNRKEFSLYASMEPAKEVGGDFYDFFLIDSDHLALVIADVSGKGVPAAMFMMTSKSLIQNQLMTGCSPAEALAAVNRQLCEHNSAMMFVTVWAAVIELSTGRGTACNAGHEHPGLGRAGKGFELLMYPHDPFLGVRKRAEFRNRDFEMKPGDCIFVYTDGVPEATRQDNQMFGEERLAEVLNEDRDADPETLVRRVRGAVDRFTEGAAQFDDITMLCYKYNGRQ